MSGYDDARRCQYCGNWIDPLELCGCPSAVADYLQNRTSGNDTVIRALRNAAKRISELEREVKHWKANHDNQVERARILIERTDLPIERVEAYKNWKELERELAAAQATIQQMREALHKCASGVASGAVQVAATEALALPSDRTALDAMLAEAEKRGMLKANAELTNYMKGAYEFLESSCPNGFAAEAFRLPPAATEAQQLLLHAIQGDAH